MTIPRLVLLLIAVTPAIATAEVDPVAIRVPETKVWTGQAATFHVQLRASGSFDGAASFSLPRIPRSVIIKVGNPVVSSEQIEGDSWFVQTHEFALFSQQSGSVKIPSFEVRFASRDGFTGPVKEQTALVPEATIEIERPPGSEQVPFLVTTASLEISESWDHQPGSAKVGALFKRTITQQAEQMTGIALPPPPQDAPPGIRVYLGDPQVTDTTERGTLSGERQDTITYVLQEAGAKSLPAITYVWWDPKAQQLQTKTLPAVTFDVEKPKASVTPEVQAVDRRTWIWWLAGAALAGGLLVWQRERLRGTLLGWWHRLNPPDRVAARHLLRACRQNDAAAASKAWLNWLALQPHGFTPDPSLEAAARELERQIYGSNTQKGWSGTAMAEAFRSQIGSRRGDCRETEDPALPTLNPAS